MIALCHTGHCLLSFSLFFFLFFSSSLYTRAHLKLLAMTTAAFCCFYHSFCSLVASTDWLTHSRRFRLTGRFIRFSTRTQLLLLLLSFAFFSPLASYTHIARHCMCMCMCMCVSNRPVLFKYLVLSSTETSDREVQWLMAKSIFHCAYTLMSPCVCFFRTHCDAHHEQLYSLSL